MTNLKVRQNAINVEYPFMLLGVFFLQTNTTIQKDGFVQDVEQRMLMEMINAIVVVQNLMLGHLTYFKFRNCQKILKRVWGVNRKAYE